MNKEEKETIKIVKSGENTFDILGIPGTSSYENLKGALKEISKYINELQKELEEKTTILMAGADKVKQLEKENQELKEENIILEGNKIGYKLAIQELEKTIDLIIDDFQAENYFVGMTNKEVKEYYKKRKELKE